jgi:hypothetical protein
MTTALSFNRQIANENIHKAFIALKKAISEKPFDHIGEIDLPTIDERNDVEENASRLETFLEETVRFRKDLQDKSGRGKKVQDVVISWFRASYPFANLLLTIAKDSSQVPTLSLSLLFQCS